MNWCIVSCCMVWLQYHGTWERLCCGNKQFVLLVDHRYHERWWHVLATPLHDLLECIAIQLNAKEQAVGNCNNPPQAFEWAKEVNVLQEEQFCWMFGQRKHLDKHWILSLAYTHSETLKACMHAIYTLAIELAQWHGHWNYRLSSRKTLCYLSANWQKNSMFCVLIWSTYCIM